jgi:hypothetical protein
MESEDFQKSDEINLCNRGLTAAIAVFQHAALTTQEVKERGIQILACATSTWLESNAELAND